MNIAPPAESALPLSIIIVNYNTAELLGDCLDSIQTQLAASDEVIVVDNNSGDGSALVVQERYPWAVLIANQTNAGFARANNQALALARGEIIWFLNPDTRLLKGALSAALDFMHANQHIGLAGTALRNPDGSVQESVEFRYPGHRYTKNLLRTLPGRIAWVSGASMVARRSALSSVGGFDENYFLYGEDLDLCLMIRKAGWPLGFIEESRVCHMGGQSERFSLPESVIRKKVTAELIFYGKHYPASAIQKIKQNNRLKALWRIGILSLQKFFGPQKQSTAAKLLKYRLAWELYR